METVSELKYLGRVLTKLDDEWTEVVANLSKTQRRWNRISKVLWREGVLPRTPGNFYKAMVQVTLFFGA